MNACVGRGRSSIALGNGLEQSHVGEWMNGSLDVTESGLKRVMGRKTLNALASIAICLESPLALVRSDIMPFPLIVVRRIVLGTNWA